MSNERKKKGRRGNKEGGKKGGRKRGRKRQREGVRGGRSGKERESTYHIGLVDVHASLNQGRKASGEQRIVVPPTCTHLHVELQVALLGRVQIGVATHWQLEGGEPNVSDDGMRDCQCCAGETLMKR
jgi:hypothetical protein